MTEISWYELGEWVQKYKEDPRNLWIYPECVQHYDGQGHFRRPIEHSTINDDSREVLAAKQAYFASATFDALPIEQKKRIVRELGVTQELAASIIAVRPEFAEAL